MAVNAVSIKMFRKVLIDGVLLIGLVLCIKASRYLWKPFKRGFFCGDQSLMMPYQDDTVSAFNLIIVVLTSNLMTFLICEWIHLRKEHDDQYFFKIRIPTWMLGFFSVLLSFSIGFCFEELTASLAKKTIGRLRPHFFEICQPSVNCTATPDRYVHAHEFQCTGERTDKIADVNLSFMSGHSMQAAYGMVFLALYLQKRMTWQRMRILRHVLQFAAILLSVYTALSRISDYKHHWSDVLAGYLVGVTLAALMFLFGTEFIERKRDHYSLPLTEIPLTVQVPVDSK